MKQAQKLNKISILYNMKKLIRFFVFALYAIKTTPSDWPNLWRAVMQPEQAAARFHLDVATNVSKDGVKLYSAFIVADATEKTRIQIEGYEPDFAPFLELCEENRLEPKAVLALLPAYQMARATNDPFEVANLINAAAMLKKGTGFFCLN